MSEQPKKNDNPNHNQNGNPPDDSSRNNVSSKQSKSGRRPRRRKYPKPGEEGCRYIVLNDIPRRNQQQNPVAGSDHALVPPGFEAVSENKKRQRDNEENNNDSNVVKVGQTLTVVIEGEFDSGFWLSVRNGNSSPALRGLLFKPESHVSAVIPDDGNNAAAGVPLVPRSVIPLFPAALAQQVHNTRNEEEQCFMNNTNETPERNESISRKSAGATLEKYAVPCLASEQTNDPLLAACKAMSVVLKPVNLTTEVPLPLRASLQKGKGISKDHGNHDPFLPINSPSPAIRINPPPSPEREVSILSKVPEDIGRNQAATSSLLSNERDQNYQPPARVVDGTITGQATILMRPPSLAFGFDRLVIEVIERIRAHSDFLDIANDDRNSGVEGSNSEQEPKMIDLEESDGTRPHSPSSSRPSKVTRLVQDKKNGEPDQD